MPEGSPADGGVVVPDDDELDDEPDEELVDEPDEELVDEPDEELVDDPDDDPDDELVDDDDDVVGAVLMLVEAFEEDVDPPPQLASVAAPSASAMLRMASCSNISHTPER